MQVQSNRAARNPPVIHSIGKLGSFSPAEFDEVEDFSGNTGRADCSDQVKGGTEEDCVTLDRSIW
jgi:hypothetical protein